MKKNKRMPGPGPLLECRKCHRKTRDPVKHLRDLHPRVQLPLTMTRMWDLFVLLAAGHRLDDHDTPTRPPKNQMTLDL